MTAIANNFARVETAEGICLRIGEKWVVLADFRVELQVNERGQLLGARASSKKLPSWLLRDIDSPNAWPPSQLIDSLEMREVSREELTYLQRLLQEAKSREEIPIQVKKSQLSQQKSLTLPLESFWSWIVSLFP